MRKTLAVIVVLALLAALPVAGAWARPSPGAGSRGGHLPADVAAVLAGLAPGEMATVVVTMRVRADLGGVRGATGRLRLRRTIEALQSTADVSQLGIRALLRLRAREGTVAAADPLWVTNSISVTATAEVVAELAARPDVASVVADEVELVPAYGAPEANQLAVGAPALWDAGRTGRGVVVASLDSGVDVSHPDLAGRWRGGTNSWFDPYGQHPTTPTDLTGHGTGTMGVMVGGDAGGTSIGTAPGATWIAAKIFDDAGSATATAVHRSFQWVLDPDGDPATGDAPRVVNGSWSIGAGAGCDLSFQPDVQALRTAGILPVFAAGNYGSGAGSSVSPANYPESLSVGAVLPSNAVYSQSSRGPSGCGGRARVFPDVVARGYGVLTADRWGLYQYQSGTSVAAPHAAGVLALLLADQPNLPADQQQAALTSTALDLGAAGPDDTYGAGLVDAQAAYTWLSTPPPPSQDFAVSLTPAEATVEAGGAATYTVAVAPLNGFAGDVALSLSGLDPAEASWVFTPSVVPAGSGSSELRVTTAAGIPPGSHPFTVSAESGALTRTAAATLTTTAPPPPPPPPPATDALELSTVGNTNPPGLSGAADDADILRWDGSAFSRVFDASVAKLAGSANVDGFDRVSPNRFYLSFSADTPVPGLGKVQDEDVVLFDGTAWSVFFDGTSKGMRSAAQDLDAISVVDGVLYFSTVGDTNPPGAGGQADDADVYRWNGGGSFSRVWDASAEGLPGSANVDGLVRVGAGDLYLSFSTTTTTVPVLGAVQDEDVVHRAGDTWSMYFDGSAHGLDASASLDVDAFDLP